jgi:uncharacterized membrane protein
MIWFILAIAFSSMIVVTFKLFDRFGVNSIQAITLNYIIALLIGSQTLGMSGLHEFVTTSHAWVPFAILNGFLFIVVLLSFAQSTKAVGIAITSVSSKTSVVLPVSMGFLLLHEGFGCLKMLGIVVALVAIYLSFRDKNTAHKPKQGLLFPLLLFFGTGLNDSVMKYAQVRYVEHQQTAYLMVVFGVALVFGFVLLIYNFIKRSQRVSWRSIVGGVVLGVLNWYSTLFMLKAMKVYDSSVLFPIFNSSIVTLAALLGFALFSEKLKPINWVGIALAILAIALIGLNSFV